MHGFGPSGNPTKIVDGQIGVGVAGGKSGRIERLAAGGERIELRFTHRQCRVQITLGRLDSSEAAGDRVRIEALSNGEVVASTTVVHRKGDRTHKAVSLGGTRPFWSVRVTALDDLDGFWLTKVVFGRSGSLAE